MLLAATGLAEARLPLVVLPIVFIQILTYGYLGEEVAWRNYGQNPKPPLAGGAGLWQ